MVLPSGSGSSDRSSLDESPSTGLENDRKQMQCRAELQRLTADLIIMTFY